jgi:hypothetical protein
MFQVFKSYVAISVFILQVVSVLFGCCICFTDMLQVYILNVSSGLDLCCIQVFHVVSVSYFRGMLRESWGTAQALGEVSGGRHMGRTAHLGSSYHSGSRVPSARREEGVRGKEWQAQPECMCGAGWDGHERGTRVRQTGDGRTHAAAIWCSGRRSQAGGLG